MHVAISRLALPILQLCSTNIYDLTEPAIGMESWCHSAMHRKTRNRDQLPQLTGPFCWYIGFQLLVGKLPLKTLLTQVDDLFYNTPTRRKALRSASDEYSRILDVVSKYAIHNAGIAMSCKKVSSVPFGQTSCFLIAMLQHSSTAFDLQTMTSSSTLDVIGQVYSASIRRELNEIEFDNEEFHFKCKGYVSSANYSAKRGTFIFFINRKHECAR